MNISSFKEFVGIYGLNHEANAGVKIKQIPNELLIPAGI